MRKKIKFTDNEKKLMNEMDAVAVQAEANPEIKNMRVPESLWNELQQDVSEYKEEKRAKEQEQRNKDLIKLGLVYERRRKYRKYYVLVATLVLVLAMGITSFGDAEKIFHRINTMISGREQEVIDSEGMVPNEYVSEDEALDAVEEQLGFYPVKINYLPEKVRFLDSMIYSEMQKVHLIYGKDGIISISYMMQPNHRDGSWGTDIEDELLLEYDIENENTIVHLKKYLLEEKIEKWLIQFEYKDVNYCLIINDLNQAEVEKIVAELHFH